MSGVAVAFVPLDDRPVTRDDWLRLAAIGGLEVRTPPASLLGHRRTPGHVDKIREWLSDYAAECDVVIASAEMLLYGGLVASRRCDDAQSVVLDRMGRVADLSMQHASVRWYVSAVNPRVPNPASEEPDYARRYGEAISAYSKLRGRRDQGDSGTLGALLRGVVDQIPSGVLEDFLWRRRRNFAANTALVALAASESIAHLLLGQDDTAPVGWPRTDLEALRAVANASGSRNVIVTHGADELNQRLLARFLNDRFGAPRILVRYSWPHNRASVPLYESDPLEQTVVTHLASANLTEDPGRPEGVLWIHNWPDAHLEAEAQGSAGIAADIDDAVRGTVEQIASLSADLPVAVADLRHANGGDDALVRALLEDAQAAGIVAYAGWNTASNTLGTAIAHLVIEHHLRAGHLTNPDARSLSRAFLLRRLAEDWGYQSVVRPRLRREVLPALADCDAGNLREHAGELTGAALDLFESSVLPVLRKAFPDARIREVRFPWGRLFEADLVVETEA